MPERKFDLGDYVEVKDRIATFYDLYKQGRLVTGEVRLTNEPDGVPRVLVQGLAYRNPEDPYPGVGWSWMELPGKTTYTKGSELENTETSAWGRAIGSLGILIDRSIASAQEVDNKSEPVAHDEPIEHNGIGGLVGTLVKGGDDETDLRIRATPTGMVWGFALKEGRHKYKARAFDDLAERLANRNIPEGTRVTVWGPIEDFPWDKKMPDGTFKSVTIRRIIVQKVKGPDWTETAEPVEAPSIPLFSDSEEATIDAALA